MITLFLKSCFYFCASNTILYQNKHTGGLVPGIWSEQEWTIILLMFEILYIILILASNVIIKMSTLFNLSFPALLISRLLTHFGHIPFSKHLRVLLIVLRMEYTRNTSTKVRLMKLGKAEQCTHFNYWCLLCCIV